jgi:hypothetical protein
LLPPDCIPVEELASSALILAFRGMQGRHNVLPQPQAPKSFAEYLSLLPSWDQRLPQHVEIPDAHALIDYFQTDGEVLFVVSDGGLTPNAAPMAPYLLLLMTFWWRSLDLLKVASLDLSEPKAMVGSLSFAWYIISVSIISLTLFYAEITFADGPLSPFPRHFLRLDIDLEMQIINTIRLLASPTAGDTPLSRQAELNIESDHLATAALQIACPSPLVTFLPVGKVAVTIEGQSINRKLLRAIRTLIGRRLQLSSSNRHYGWSASQFDQIDWMQSYRSATSKLSLKKRLFVIKWLNNILPFQVRMHKHGQSSL